MGTELKPVVAVVGGQDGDEGKGKVISALFPRIDVGVRCNGGANAGHTVIFDGKEYKFHMLPSTAAVPRIVSVIAPNTVVHTGGLIREIDSVRATGVEIDGNLKISDRSQFLGDFHRAWDGIQEARRGAAKIGTTGTGNGAAYTDLVDRNGIFLGLLKHPDLFKKRLASTLEDYRVRLRYEDMPDSFRLDYYDPIIDEAIKKILPYLTDTSAILESSLASGKKILFEKAQAAMLDVRYGGYPYVTSSTCTASAITYEVGLSKSPDMDVIGVFKAYHTDVGERPRPAKMADKLEAAVREAGREYGTTTGRKRNVSWFDAVKARHSARIGGYDFIALNKSDVLTNKGPQLICEEYIFRGEPMRNFPVDSLILEECTPVYREYPGWEQDFRGAKNWNEVPPEAQNLLIAQHQAIGRGRLWMVGTGPADEDAIFSFNLRASF